MYHNDTVRITQLLYEQQAITIRQSRLLDIASESCMANDVLLLLRWMACIPLPVPEQADTSADAVVNGGPEPNVRGNAAAGANAGEITPFIPTTPLRGPGGVFGGPNNSPAARTDAHVTEDAPPKPTSMSISVPTPGEFIDLPMR